MPTDHALLDQAGAEFDQALKLYGKGREADAEILCRRAIAKGLDGIKVQLFLARLWQNQGRLDEAEQALRAAVRLDPASPPAQRELAQLIWMRTRRFGSGACRTGCGAAHTRDHLPHRQAAAMGGRR